MENLPFNINTKIFVRLPIKTLGQLKCVSKSFKTLITSHRFNAHRYQTLRLRHLLLADTRLHTLNVFQYYNTCKLPINAGNKHGAPLVIRVVGSCNGLVCLHYDPNTYSFFNPTTREFRVLPYPTTFTADLKHINLTAFGYVSLSDDYMVVNFFTEKIGDGESLIIRIYSATADSWKTILKQVSFRILSKKPVCANGVIHWLGFSGKYSPGDKITRYDAGHKIIGFDLAHEEFKVLSL